MKLTILNAMGLAVLIALPAQAVEVHGKVPLKPVAEQSKRSLAAYPGQPARSATTSETKGESRHSVVFLVPKGPAESRLNSGRARLDQKDFSFIPHVLVIPIGTTVDFYNLDPVFHNVFSFSKTKRFDLGRYPRNKFKSVTFDKPGLVKLFCEIHSDMNAYILVLNTTYFAFPDQNGEFSISNVSPGEYNLRVWQEQGDAFWVDVEIADQDKVLLDKATFFTVSDQKRIFE